jgi:hypothetical protein
VQGLRVELCDGDGTHYPCSGFVNGKVCGNGQRFRRDVMESRLLAAIRTELLSDASIERFKAKLARRLRRPPSDAARMRKLEGELASITDLLAQGVRSTALLERIQSTEAELERFRNAAKVVDVAGVLAMLPVAVRRYRETASNLGSSSIDMEHAREVIREIADRIPVRPGDDGVPVAELSLNDQMPLGQVAGGSQIGLVAGACYELVQYSRFSPRKASAGPSCRQAAAATATNSLPTTLCALGRGTRCRCRQCRADRATAWRRRRRAVA